MNEALPAHRLPHVVPAETGRPIDWRSKMLVKAGVAEIEGRFTVIHTTNTPSSGPPLHVHAHEDEAFLVLEGDYSFFFGDQQVLGKPGDFVLLPRGLPHRYRVGESGGKVLMLFAPAGIEEYFHELASVLGDDAAENAVAAKYGITLVGSYGDGVA